MFSFIAFGLLLAMLISWGLWKTEPPPPEFKADWDRFSGVGYVSGKTDNVIPLDTARWVKELRKAGWAPNARYKN